MDEVQLKSNIHSFIDQIDSISLLKEYYDELKMLINSKKTSIWDSLSEAQKQDVLISFEESEDSENILSREDIMMS